MFELGFVEEQSGVLDRNSHRNVPACNNARLIMEPDLELVLQFTKKLIIVGDDAAATLRLSQAQQQGCGRRNNPPIAIQALPDDPGCHSQKLCLTAPGLL